MTKRFTRRKVSDGEYEVLDNGERVALVYEAGVRGYRWRVSPVDDNIRGWDTSALANAVDAFERMAADATRARAEAIVRRGVRKTRAGGTVPR